MQGLSEEQISCITDRLKSDKIAYSHLFDDLLDHICCDIEDKIQQGIDYNLANKMVFENIGFNGLKEIQEATIFYVKLNLIVMKKVMNVMAIAGTVILAISFLFKISHWPGGSLLLFLGFLILFLGFFPVALLSIRTDLSIGFFTKKFGIYLIGFICLVETGAAVLFKSMHWPGGNLLALISFVLIMLVFFPILLFNIFKNEKNRTINLSLAVFALMFMGTSIVMSYNSHTNPDKVIEYVFISQETDFYNSAVEQEIKNLPKEISDSLSTELNKFNTSLDSVEFLINNYQQLILNGEIDIFQVSRKFLHSSVINNEYDDCFKTLKIAISNLQSDARILCSTNSTLLNLVDIKLSTSTYDLKQFNDEGLSWERRYFYKDNVGIYTSLHRLLRDSYQIKYEIIRNISQTPAPGF